jgi:hypothetical protein
MNYILVFCEEIQSENSQRIDLFPIEINYLTDIFKDYGRKILNNLAKLSIPDETFYIITEEKYGIHKNELDFEYECMN